jgi:hypothetical protein
MRTVVPTSPRLFRNTCEVMSFPPWFQVLIVDAGLLLCSPAYLAMKKNEKEKILLVSTILLKS